MKYRCLALDHDDTLVDSTATVNYPAFLKTLDLIRPEVKKPTLKEFFKMNFDPGFNGLCRDIYEFNDDEMKIEFEVWLDHIMKCPPPVYEGMTDLVNRFRAEGGIICVVSHSMDVNILRDYRVAGLEPPDRIFAWDDDETKRKPSPWAFDEIKRIYGIDYSEILMIDDMRSGLDMAKKRNVDFVAVGWSHTDIPEIEEYMKRECENYCETPKDLERFIFG